MQGMMKKPEDEVDDGRDGEEQGPRCENKRQSIEKGSGHL